MLELSQLWDDPENISGDSGRKYYRRAIINWSVPRVWQRSEREFNVPPSWRGQGGIYAFIRSHWRQNDDMRLAYIGKANNFNKRLTNAHNHFGIVERRGDTAVSCGRVSFDRVRSRKGHYLEIEDIIKFCVYDWLENKQGFDSLPGFRKTQPRSMMPWVILNKGYRFGGFMPRRIVYPSIGVEY
jgi:hypothetical protein